MWEERELDGIPPLDLVEEHVRKCAYFFFVANFILVFGGFSTLNQITFARLTFVGRTTVDVVVVHTVDRGLVGTVAVVVEIVVVVGIVVVVVLDLLVSIRQ